MVRGGFLFLNGMFGAINGALFSRCFIAWTEGLRGAAPTGLDADEGETTHPYLARGWAEQGAELRGRTSNQSHGAAIRAAFETFNQNRQMLHLHRGLKRAA